MKAKGFPPHSYEPVNRVERWRLVDQREARTLALLLCDAAHAEPNPKRKTDLEREALRCWQAARRAAS